MGSHPLALATLLLVVALATATGLVLPASTNLAVVSLLVVAASVEFIPWPT